MKKLLRLSAGFAACVLAVSPAWADETSDATPADAVADDGLAQAEEEADAEASTEEVAVEASTEEEEEGSLIAPFSVSFSIRDSFTVGAIFRDPETVNNYNLMSFRLGGSYATPVDTLSVGLTLSLSKFTTDAGGETYQREARFGDIEIGAEYGTIWSDEEVTGLNLGGSFGFTLPTSDASQFTNLYTSMGLGFELSRSFGDLTIATGIEVGKDFHEHTSVVADLEDYDLDVIARDGGAENIGEAQIALDTGVLSEWMLGNSLSLSYRWFEGFSTSLAFTFRNYWTYDNGTITQDDEFTSEFADPGRGHAQTMTGSIGARYAFLEYFSAGLSLSTTQQPLTADNQSVRFPFWDFETGNLSNTTLALSLSASY